VIDDIRLAYTALRAQRATADDGLAILPIPTVPGVYVGLDDKFRQHLLLTTNTDTTVSVGVTTLSVTMEDRVIGAKNTRVLDVTCLLEVLAEVFDHFVAAVVERVSIAGDSANEAVENVLRRWREFLVPPKGPLGLDKLAATFGELLVVLDVVRATGVADIGYWVGPFGGRHDMRTGSTALEVKTTRSHTGHRVTIHGEDQLLAPVDGNLYLHFVRLEKIHGGSHSVLTLVDDLLAAGVSAEKLFEALTAGGVPVVDLRVTGEVSFDVRERVTLPVDDRMPRIVPASFVGGRRPPGVVDISYVVDLTSRLDDALNADSYANLLPNLAPEPGA
jgi:hypothetical protein